MDESERYNRIATIEEQDLRWERLVTEDDLRRLGGVFYDTDSMRHFGLALLHRHNDIPASHAMVHSYGLDGQDSCQAEKIGMRSIYPCSYHLHEERFVPFEYSTDPQPVPSPALVDGVRRSLKDCGLEHVLAISCISFPRQFWVEEVQRDGTGTVARMVTDFTEEHGGAYVNTAWAVQRQDGIYSLQVLRVCEIPKSGGGHNVVERA